MNALSLRKGLLSRLGHILQDVICMLNRLSWLQVVFVKTQCYEYRFGARFGLSIGTDILVPTYFGVLFQSVSELCYFIIKNIYIINKKTYINY